MEKTNAYFRLSLRCDESRGVTLDEVGLFLYDFSSLYELSRIALDPKYADFEFSRFSLYRNGKPILPKDKMYVERIRHESPSDIVVYILAGAGVSTIVWNTIQIIDKYFGPSQRKLQLEIRKLERDERKVLKSDKTLVSLSDAEERIEERGATRFISKVVERLRKSPISIISLDIELVNQAEEQKSIDSLHRWAGDGKRRNQKNRTRGKSRKKRS